MLSCLNTVAGRIRIATVVVFSLTTRSLTARSLTAFSFAAVAGVANDTLHAQSAPARQSVVDFDCDSRVKLRAASVTWTAQDDAVRLGEWRIAVGRNSIPLLVVVAVVAPGKTQLSLDIAREDDHVGPWTLDNAPATARFALNAGQFTDDGPWGWVVHRGRELQPPGTGAVAGALIVDSAGHWALLDAAEIQARRGRNVSEAVQSYPTLLSANASVPPSLCKGSNDIDRSHRDTRLAVGTLPGGELVIAMTRFDGLGATIGRLPIGPTTPEMITIMRALGATRALMLDGGLSAQFMVRAGSTGGKAEWPGLRSVPLALIGLPVVREPLR